MGKNNEYLEISKQIVANIGGMDNIQGTAHCATRLRIKYVHPSSERG